DNEDLRRIPSTILRQQGYVVLEARDGAEALRQIESAPRIDLIFTDLILPGGMNGLEIAAQAKHLSPTIRVIYTTGYAETALASGGELDPGMNLISKPYRQANLLAMVRTVLDDAKA
ncbi:MAG: response regulator, partial [Hyphomicrobiales bacterium]|nr:response regulator [Hyphomicrobiales bacterium]